MLFPTGGSLVRVLTKYGSVIRVDPDEYIGGIVIRHGYYESEVLDAVRPFLGSGSVFWDVGANVGLHAVTAKVIAPETLVCAFEPMAGPRCEMVENARLNGVAIKVVGAAMNDESAPAIIRTPPDGRNIRSTLRPDYADCSWHQEVIDCVCAEELIDSEKVPMPTVIKLDVEGVESAVLRGLGRYVKDRRLRAIVFEGSVGLCRPGSTDPLGNFLAAHGFVISQLERQEPTHHGLENYLAARH